LVTAFLEMLAEMPDVMAALKRVPVLRELFSSLALLIGVKLDFGPVQKMDSLNPITVELDMAKLSPEKVGTGRKPAIVPPKLVAEPVMGD
jgi:hypothetical protein